MTRDRPGLRLRAKILPALALLVLVVVLGRNVLATIAVQASIRSLTGMRVEIRHLDMGLVTQRLRLRGLRLLNPPAFHHEVLADIPEVDVSYNFPALLQQRLHLRRAVIRIGEIGIVRNEQGETNVEYLRRRLTPPSKALGPTQRREAENFLIDRIVLSIGAVKFYDYAGGSPPKVTEFDLGIHEEPFEGITDRKTLVGLLILKVMSKSALGRLPDLDLDLDAVEQGVRQSMKSGLGLLKGAAGK